MADNLKGIPFSSELEGIDFPMKAKLLVLQQHNEFGVGTPRGEKIVPLTLDEVYVIWFSFTLGNWKAFVSTSRPDGRVYEISYKQGNDVAFVDSYLKTHNMEVDIGWLR